MVSQYAKSCMDIGWPTLWCKQATVCQSQACICYHIKQPKSEYRQMEAWTKLFVQYEDTDKGPHQLHFHNFMAPWRLTPNYSTSRRLCHLNYLHFSVNYAHYGHATILQTTNHPHFVLENLRLYLHSRVLLHSRMKLSKDYLTSFCANPFLHGTSIKLPKCQPFMRHAWGAIFNALAFPTWLWRAWIGCLYSKVSSLQYNFIVHSQTAKVRELTIESQGMAVAAPCIIHNARQHLAWPQLTISYISYFVNTIINMCTNILGTK